MAKAKKKTKPRPDKYEDKLSINGTFEDVIKVSVIPLPKPEKEDPKKIAPKKKK